jgi:hypothetical protein
MLHMKKRSLAVFVLIVGLITALSAPAAAATTRISGVGTFDSAGVCPGPPAGYGDFTDFTIVMTGSLEGCWYTKVLTSKETPSGVYLETGEEVFVGRLDGGPQGTFTTTYRFESKFAPDGSEIHGRCQHPLAAGSGTGGFAGATGRVDFKDDVVTGELFYRGHIKLG